MNRFLQALIALSGLAITGLLGWQSIQNDRKQEQVAWITLIVNQLNVASTSCGVTPAAIAQDAILSLPEAQQAKYKELIQQVLDGCAGIITVPPAQELPWPAPEPNAPAAEDDASGDPAPVPAPTGPTTPADQPEVVQAPPIAQTATPYRNLEVKLGESPRGKGVSMDDKRWRAVLASYVAGEEKVASEHFLELKDRIAKSAPGVTLGVYFTPGSKHYVLALSGGSLSREEARDLTGQAVKNGWSSDAFVQSDTAWATCRDPGQAGSLDACRAAGGS